MISPNYEHSFLFESLTGPEILAETSVMGFDPAYIVRGYSDRVEITGRDGGVRVADAGDPLEELRQAAVDVGHPYRYLGGAVGRVNYDAAGLWERVPRKDPPPEPLMEFGVYDDGILYDNRQGRLYYFHLGEDRFSELLMSGKHGDVRVSNFRAETCRDEYEGMVGRAKEYVNDGDVFQVVLSRRTSFDVEGDELAIYGALRKLNPSPYMYHLKQGKSVTIGASPEMLVRADGRTAETFPIAGTRKTVPDEAENLRLADELRHDEKELAEHTMLVDLGRNDMGRVCEYGSVHVEDLMGIRRFSHVQHMVTHVTGRLGEGHDAVDAFKAVFPAGTVSGAPKVRAMEIIDELEPVPRGPYAGAVGYFAHNGCCDFAIAIRSIFIEGGRGFVQAGAGIVSDSVPSDEFDETEHKAGAMLQALREASR
ncbi:anthranilate/para-aminobenzoate synthases component I [Cenarchaeum symbiosum A]|uniref:anthranilate synthase n=1 Tax=Cenarchaeum symbiosum (strain A) TaxID=414004 RepID=A0RX36_CENSY|nr:anthranilate/para-aminobenzoate synthases component I [Cenarchaeum symbiosum A]